MKSRFYPFTIFILTLLAIVNANTCAYANNHTNVVDAIVNIEFNKVIPWDDGYNSSGFGTGFVIDAEQGIILTNKHIVNVSPIVAFAEFSNNRKLPITPIYRDPVHDFGMFKYDPSKIADLNIKPIKLNNTADIGQPIILYGNDGGEALSIIEGVLSRLDRPAPDYNSTNNDYNTFYMQAALGTSGGSSGSPILNQAGEAIAINAGGRFDTATAFFLPMKMMKPIIDKIIKGAEVSRGTLQVVFEYVPYNQMKKYGKTDTEIQSFKDAMPESKGRLLITHIAKDSPADKQFSLGDILLTIDNQNITEFYALETKLNASVGQTISVTVDRKGSADTFTLPVSDLFALVPDEYIEFGKTIFTPIGLSLARLFNVPSEGVLMTSDGRVFGGHGIRNYARIDEIDDTPIANLEQLKSKLESIPINKKVSVRYRYVYNEQNQEFVKIRNLPQFFTNRHCESVLGEQLWACNQLQISDNFAQTSKAGVNKTVSSPFVDLEVFRPLEVNIEGDVTLRGLGLIIDKVEGLILTDKGIIDSSLSQANLYFDNGATSSAEVLAIHPYLNLVLLKADMSQITFTEGVIPKLEPLQLKDFDEAKLLGRSSHLDYEAEVSIGWPLLINANTNFDSHDVTYLPEGFSLYLSNNDQILGVAPGYSDKHSVDAIIPAELIIDFVKTVRTEQTQVFELKDQLGYVSFAEAVELGLSTPYLDDVSRKIFVQQAAELEKSGLKSGDIILGIDDKRLNNLNTLFLSLTEPVHQLTILRNGSISQIPLTSKRSKLINLSQVLVWGGSIIHEMPININTPYGTRSTCLRIGFRYFGAPIYSALGSDPACVITVDDKTVETAEDLKDILFEKQSGEFTKVLAVRLDKNFQLAEYQVREENFYWPTIFYTRSNNEWEFSSTLD